MKPAPKCDVFERDGGWWVRIHWPGRLVEKPWGPFATEAEALENLAAELEVKR